MNEFHKFSIQLAKESGKIIRKYFRTSYDVTLKADASPVTIADKKAEEIMREMIMGEFPEHGILGEEFEPHNPEAEYVWILDPIDGTNNFICGGHAFGTLIALLRKDTPVLGVLHQPVLEELLTGDNRRCNLNGADVKVRSCARLSDAVLLTSDLSMIEQYQNIQSFNELKKQVRIYRGWGDCYGYFLLATGQVDIMVDPIMNLWDIMALIPIIRGAGGTITDYQGREPHNVKSLIATSGTIHQEVISILNSPAQNHDA